MTTRLTKAQREAEKKKRDREVMFWGVAGCVIIIGFALGWGKFTPITHEESLNITNSYTEEVSDVVDMQIDDILDAVGDRCDKIDEETYVMTLDELRDILEMVLKDGEEE